MPYYTYEHPETKEIIEVFQTMLEPHVLVKEGVTYNRVFLPPNTCIDGKLNPLSPKDFVEKTRNKKGTLGDLFDLSKEASIKREQMTGKDSIKDAYFQDYKNKRRGKIDHPIVRKEQLKQELSKNFEVEL